VSTHVMENSEPNFRKVESGYSITPPESRKYADAREKTLEPTKRHERYRLT